jgi:hypothetical protein
MYNYKPDHRKMIWELLPNTEPIEDQITILQRVIESVISSKASDLDKLSLKEKLDFITECSAHIHSLKQAKLELDQSNQQLEIERLKVAQESKDAYINKLFLALHIYKEIYDSSKPTTNEEFQNELDKLQSCLNFINRVQVSEISGLQ